MIHFNFEKNLEHQSKAVSSTVDVFSELEVKPTEEAIDKQFTNPVLDNSNINYIGLIRKIREKNFVKEGEIKYKSNIIDIMMETGTGKTYTYTKTIFELNKLHGIFKFVIIVPTLSIKAGTIDFLQSESCREHFKEQYNKTLNLHVVESQKSSKSKKSYLPSAIGNFVNAEAFAKDFIQVLIINAGMINSETMQKSFDRNLFDKYSIPFEAIRAIKPLVIIDEPHKFSQGNKTWENIQKIKPQYILRYGATFPEYENLIYTLTAVDSFNKNLVKGVIGHITEFASGNNTIVKFTDSNGTEATFELNTNGKKHSIKLTKKESLEKIHNAMQGLFIENLNKSTVVLSNGLELKKNDKINPYSYAETLQETMMAKAIKKHFELEKELLQREVKIKPLTLFFIDNIDEYRNANGYLRNIIEKYVKVEVETLLTTEINEFYRKYLEKTLVDISKTHGGYFSKDNSGKDDAIEQEVVEILHDKQAMLSLDNPRRFIFSKWTLREGWDNPNVFQICKLRSSGSEISKLQEVGRGLRLPVNQYGNRVKDEQFYLNYFVDFTENDFVEQLVNEINNKSGAISYEKNYLQLNDAMITQLMQKYGEQFDNDKNILLSKLDDANIINRSNEFKASGLEYIKTNYPLIFDGIGTNKIRQATEIKKKIRIRTEKYSELQDLWEKINQKVILEYKIDNEIQFKQIFVNFLQEFASSLTQDILINRQTKVNFSHGQATAFEEISIQKNEITQLSTMKYDDFIKQLSQNLKINIKTIHQGFIEANIEINKYLNISTIRLLKQKFDMYLLYKAIDVFGIEYQKVTNSVYATKFTNKQGKVLNEINSSDIGVLYSDEKVATNYFLDELFYDSELEKNNITTNIDEVIVFTKIPKNSIKIPIAGGKSYSPDFAYVINFNNGKKKMYFVVETKNSDEGNLKQEELHKIKHAEQFFGDTIKIKFMTQFSNKKITDLIREIHE